MKNKVKNLIDKIKKSVMNEIFVMDFLFLLGIFIIIITNFLVNGIFGLYFLGLILMAYSVFLNKTKKKER